MKDADFRARRARSISELHEMVKRGDLSAVDELNRRERKARPSLSERAMAASAPSKKAGTIDLTPTWISLVGTFLVLYENGTTEQRDFVNAELTKMATAADLYNASVKNG